MAEQVFHRYGHRLGRLAAAHSVAGDGLLERMRSTTFALFGVTAAVGLGFVALIASQGWPVRPLGPIQGPSAGHRAVGDAAVVAAPGAASRRAALGSAVPAGGPDARRAAAHPRPASSGASGSHSRVSGFHRLPSAPAASAPSHGGQSGEAATQDAAAPAQPAGSAPAAPPAPQEAQPPTAVASTPPPVVSSVGKGNGNAYGRVRHHADSAAALPHGPGSGPSSHASTEHGHGARSTPKPSRPPAEPTDEGLTSEAAPEAPAEPSTESRGHGHGYGHHGW